MKLKRNVIGPLKLADFGDDKEINIREALLTRIQSYLELGGSYNPECMEHDKVRDLILDVREYLLKN